MRIIQLTDLHVGEAGEVGYEVDNRANFLKILKAAQALNPDFLVVTGDLCLKEGSMPVYQWIKGHLDSTGIPYEVISGNHDEPGMMAEVFNKQKDLHNGELYFSRKMGNYIIPFLDTTPGKMSQDQLNWLQNCLQTIDKESIIFMHHPPMLANMPWMDARYPFQMRDAIQEILLAHPYPIHVFCGHYHIEKTVQQRNLTMNITPSCYFQIDPHSLEFKIDHYKIALREIEIDDDIIRHSVHYY